MVTTASLEREGERARTGDWREGGRVGGKEEGRAGDDEVGRSGRRVGSNRKSKGEGVLCRDCQSITTKRARERACGRGRLMEWEARNGKEGSISLLPHLPT